MPLTSINKTLHIFRGRQTRLTMFFFPAGQLAEKRHLQNVSRSSPSVMVISASAEVEDELEAKDSGGFMGVQ